MYYTEDSLRMLRSEYGSVAPKSDALFRRCLLKTFKVHERKNLQDMGF